MLGEQVLGNSGRLPHAQPPYYASHGSPRSLVQAFTTHCHSCTWTKPNSLEVSKSLLMLFSFPFPKPCTFSQHTRNFPEEYPHPGAFGSDMFSTSVRVPLPHVLTRSLTSPAQHTVCYVIVVPLDHELLQGKNLYKPLHHYLCSPAPGFLNLTLLTFGAGDFFVVGGCPVYGRTFSGILPLSPLDASSTTSPKLSEPKMSPDSVQCSRGEKNHPWLRTIVLHPGQCPAFIKQILTEHAACQVLCQAQVIEPWTRHMPLPLGVINLFTRIKEWRDIIKEGIIVIVPWRLSDLYVFCSFLYPQLLRQCLVQTKWLTNI